jgi:4-amino-4-deoxy-L-arabinose transferase-like glycosyltransferase
VTRRRAYALVISACVLPRLAILLYERGNILSSFTEKSDDFARTFVASGTFGFVPGEPSAWVQPLYAFFLIPIYWIFGRGWAAVGFLQLAVAAGAALLVYETGRRFISRRAGLLAALIATLNPYLLWHDVHLNREILDTFLAAALVLLTLLAAERGRRHGLLLAALAGLSLGLAILGNTRLVFLPLVIAAFLAWQTRTWTGAALCVGVCALTLVPWAVRNEVSVGCFTLTTDTKALWKANNEQTYATLAAGKWIDDVPNLPGAPYTPEEASTLYYGGGQRIHVDECAQMGFYRRRVLDFWSDEPGEKARLSGQAVRMLWDPRVLRTEGRPGAGGAVDRARTWVQPLYEIPLYALALVGLFLVPRRVAVLIVALLLYQTLAAVGFAGATRYRVPWDFTLALAASATLVQLAGWLSSRARARSPGPTPAEPAP